MLTDFHCHLDFLTDLGKRLEKAKEAGIGRFVTSALSEESIERSFSIAVENPNVLVTIGIDSANPVEVTSFEKRLEAIEENMERLFGIGEIGLDYARSTEAEKEKQREAFLAALCLAEKLKLPAIVHSRSSGKYALSEIERAGISIPVIMHAFDGRPFYALEAINGKENLFFSIPPSIVRSEQKQRLAKALPIERILLESDAPSLGPVQGEDNEPANISLTIAKIAEIRGVSSDELKGKLAENGENLAEKSWL